MKTSTTTHTNCPGTGRLRGFSIGDIRRRDTARVTRARVVCPVCHLDTTGRVVYSQQGHRYPDGMVTVPAHRAS